MKNGPSKSYKKKYTCAKQDTNDWKKMNVYEYQTESCKQKQWTFQDTDKVPY